MLITDLAYFLEVEGVGVQGTDLFIAKLPDNTNNCILISQTGDDQDSNLPISNYRIQVLVRNKAYNAGYVKAVEIYNLLHGSDDKKVLKTGGVDIMNIIAIQTPTYIGQDGKERYVFTCNYNFKIRNIA